MASVEQKGNAYRSLVGNHNKKDELESFGIGGRIMLRWI